MKNKSMSFVLLGTCALIVVSTAIKFSVIKSAAIVVAAPASMGSGGFASVAPVSVPASVPVFGGQFSIQTPKSVEVADVSGGVSNEVAELALELDNPHLSDSGNSAETIDLRVDRLASRLTIADANQLVELAVSPVANHNARFLAVSLLSQRPNEFHHQLESIASAEHPLLSQAVQPHTSDELQRHFEEANRVAALGALDTRNLQGQDEAGFFAQLRDSSRNPLIRKVAAMGYVGAQNHQALINRYLDAK